MKAINIFLILFAISFTSYSQIKFKIECTILNADSLTEATLMDFDQNQYKQKVIPIIDNKFTIEGEAKHPGLIIVGSDKVKGGLGLWATNGTYEATFYVKGKLLQPFSANGSQEASDYIQFFNQQNGLLNIEPDLLKRNTIKTQILENFVKSHLNSYLSLFYLQSAFYYCNSQKVKELFNLMPNNLKESNEGIRLASEIVKVENNAIGNTIFDFELPDANNEKVKASKFIHSYTVIDFWAPSCGPCRIDNRKLSKNQSIFDDKAIKLLSISLDPDTNIWKNAIEKDGMKWTQLIDKEGFKSETSSQFKITSIPYLIMVDKQMKIVALGYEDIIKFAEKL